MTVTLLTKQHLEFLSLKGGFTGSSVSTLSKCHIVGNYMSRSLLVAADNLCKSLDPDQIGQNDWKLFRQTDGIPERFFSKRYF